MRRFPLIPALCAAGLLLGACQRDDGRTLPPPASVVDTPAPPATTIPAPTAPATVAPTVAASTTTVAASVAPSSVGAASTSVPPATTAPATAAPSTAVPAEAPPTTASIAAAELVLGLDGIGTALFGTAPDAATQYIDSIIGSDTGDSGWVAPELAPGCQGSEGRRVDWGVLSLVFTDESPAASGERHLSGWIYGFVGELGGQPTGLRTDAGVTLGSTVAELKQAYPEVSILEGDPQSNFPDSFYVDETLRGLITAVDDTGLVVVMYGGDICGD